MVRLSLLLLIIFSPQAVYADSHAKTTIGWIEAVQVLPEGLDFIAKIDTGADHSSLDVSEWKVFQKQGKDWVRFTLRNTKSQTYELERPLLRYTHIKRKRSESVKRPVVMMQLCINDISAVAKVNLSKRDNFKYRMLIGRSYLADRFVVDPAKQLTMKPACN